MKELVQHTESVLGPVDILVNNAGTMYYTDYIVGEGARSTHWIGPRSSGYPGQQCIMYYTDYIVGEGARSAHWISLRSGGYPCKQRRHNVLHFDEEPQGRWVGKNHRYKHQGQSISVSRLALISMSRSVHICVKVSIDINIKVSPYLCQG